MKIQERNMELKKLNDIKRRAENGVHTHEDYRVMVNVLIKLVKSAKID